MRSFGGPARQLVQPKDVGHLDRLWVVHLRSLDWQHLCWSGDAGLARRRGAATLWISYHRIVRVRRTLTACVEKCKRFRPTW